VSFVDGATGKISHNYLHLQRALFNSDLSASKKVAASLSESLTDERKSLKMIAENMAAAESLKTIRSQFSAFTNEVESLITDALTAGTIYKQFCPMAEDNNGAYWLADVKDIRNPYFGDRMAKCGKTISSISK
ncbi:MAG: DUF3347 domain-containing protein, partial [Cyclobacteriaceae bacterium]